MNETDQFTYMFKIENPDGDYFGIVTAPNFEELFWLLDEFTDPGSVLLAKVPICGICVRLVEIDGSPDEIEWVEFEPSEHFMMTADSKRVEWTPFYEVFKSASIERLRGLYGISGDNSNG